MSKINNRQQKCAFFLKTIHKTLILGYNLFKGDIKIYVSKLLLTFLTLIVPFALASCEPRYFDDVKVAKIKDIYNMNANDPVAASGILFRAASKATWYLTDGTSTIKVYDRDGNIDHDKDLNYDFQKVLIKGKVSEFAGLKQIAM